MDWSNANISTYCRVHKSLPTSHSCVSSGSALHACGIRFQRKRALALRSPRAQSQQRGWSTMMGERNARVIDGVVSHELGTIELRRRLPSSR